MRDNALTSIIGARVRLVPYLPEHIETYHGWMQDEELLRLTCSEPLTIDEERQNQQSWRDDPNKVTFIVCALDAGTHDATAGMCGDVNAFLSLSDADDASKADEGTAVGSMAGAGGRVSAELEVMIADPQRRRQGLAREALLLFMHWLLNHVPNVASLVVKITDDNLPSIRLFEAIGFAVHKHLAVFEQTELRMDVATARAAVAHHWEELGARELRLDEEQAAAGAGLTL